MGFVFVLLVLNLLTIIGSVITGYQAHEVAAFLALNLAGIGVLFGMFAMNGTKALYDIISGTARGEVNDRKIE